MRNILLRTASLLTLTVLGAATGYSTTPEKGTASSTTESKAVEAKAADAKVTESKVAETKIKDKKVKEEYVYVTVTGSNIPKRIKKSDIAAGKLPKDVQMQLMDKEQLRNLHSAPLKGN